MSIAEERTKHTAQAARIIDAAKDAVPVIDFADRLVAETGAGRWRRVGVEWVTNCVLADHEDRVPSFTVNPESNLWYCHGCARGGDVVRLACLAWGYAPRSRDEQGAAAQLLSEFGHEIPARPATWFAKNKRQQPIRDAIDRARFEHLRRRLFRTFFRASVAAIEDDEEREQEYRALWDASEPLALMMLDEVKARARRSRRSA